MFQNICPAVLETSKTPSDQRLSATVAANVLDQVKLLKRTPVLSPSAGGSRSSLQIIHAVDDLQG